MRVKIKISNIKKKKPIINQPIILMGGLIGGLI